MTRFPFAVVALLAVIAGSASAQSVDGIWRSEGYGWVFDIRGDSLRASEVTALSCIATIRAHRETAVPAGAVAAFKFDDAPVIVQLLRGRSADEMRLHCCAANALAVSWFRPNCAELRPSPCQNR